jgi:hypothetical protein
VAHRHDVDVGGAAGRCVLEAEPSRNGAAPVSALGQVAVVSQYVGHQRGEQVSHLARSDWTRWAAREAESRQGRRDDFEGVGGAATEAFRMGQGFDDVEKFDDRSRPTMGDD